MTEKMKRGKDRATLLLFHDWNGHLLSPQNSENDVRSGLLSMYVQSGNFISYVKKKSVTVVFLLSFLNSWSRFVKTFRQKFLNKKIWSNLSY
jgi:ABC-type microcin C transport system permease subunit YejE